MARVALCFAPLGGLPIPRSSAARPNPPRMASSSPSPAMAPAEEQFDVLSAFGSKTGASVPRSQVHRDGLWHRSTHVWVAARHERAVLLQKRSAEKDTFPGRWDVSAAGHVSAGAESAETARRELAEELGVNGPVDYLFTARAQATGVANGVAFVDREFQDVYLFAGGDVDLGAVVMQPEEVDEVRYWNVDDYRRALEEKDDRFVPRSPDYLARLLLWFDSHMPATSSH